MPKIRANDITLNYDQQGSGEPLVLIPYLAADHACYAFQVAEYSKHFTCISVDLRGTGESDKRLPFGWPDYRALLSAIARSCEREIPCLSSAGPPLLQRSPILNHGRRLLWWIGSECSDQEADERLRQGPRRRSRQ